MAGVVNLRAVRKARNKVAKKAAADQNAVKFGRSKAEKDREAALADKARRDLDGHERA